MWPKSKKRPEAHAAHAAHAARFGGIVYLLGLAQLHGVANNYCHNQATVFSILAAKFEGKQNGENGFCEWIQYEVWCLLQLQIKASLVSYNTLKSRFSVLGFVSQISPKPQDRIWNKKLGSRLLKP